MNLKRSLLFPLACLLLLLPLTSQAAVNNGLGFRAHVEADGTFRPRLVRVTVTSVRRGSPAAAAGLTVGDQIIEANGVTILGAPVLRTSKLISETAPGEFLLLTVKRGPGIVINIPLVAGSP